MNPADHLMIAPVVLPLFAGAMMLALGGERHRNINAALNVVTNKVHSTFNYSVERFFQSRCSELLTPPPVAWQGCIAWVTGPPRSLSYSWWTGWPPSCCC